MATKSFFSDCVITKANKDNFFEMLRSKDKHPCASDKEFIKVTDEEEIQKLMKGTKKNKID